MSGTPRRPDGSGSGKTSEPITGLTGRRPALKGTWKSVEACAAWVFSKLAEGQITPKQADSLNQSIRSVAMKIRGEHGMTELEQLRTLKADMEAIVNQTKAAQVADRYGQGADASAPGRWPDSVTTTATPDKPKS